MITPKEEAKELVDKFYNSNSMGDIGWMCKEDAKICALIHVNEILDNFGLHKKKHYASYYTIEHYREVKKEIEKL